jgi:phage terminase small subunit
MLMYRSGSVRTALVVDQFNEGIDIPEANVVVFLRSTSSKVVFFQQLGRTLRKVVGKEKARVIDIAGNCERLEMLHSLKQAVAGAPGPRQPFQRVDVHFNLNFTGAARRVLDLVTVIRNRLDRAQMIADLQRLAEELGRTPGQVDIEEASKRGNCASPSSYARVFGSLSSAQEAAELSPRRQERSREQLLDDLRKLAAELGRTPSAWDIGEASKRGKFASANMYHRTFGSLVAAQAAAGLVPNVLRRTREQLLDDLRKLAEELGRTPSYADIEEASKRGKFASANTYHKTFGSLVAAQTAAGLAPNVLRRTREQLLDDLRKLAEELGRTPSFADIAEACKLGKRASANSYYRAFGSLSAALDAANLSRAQF